MAVLGAPDPPSDFHEPRHCAGFSKHLQYHAKRTCLKCIWAQRSSTWKRATTIHPVHCQKSWIEVRPAMSLAWGLGCWVCRQATGGECGSFGQLGVACPSKSRLMRHHKSSCHNRSVQMLLRPRGLLGGEADGIAAPSLEEFAAVLQRIRRGEAEAPLNKGARAKHVTMSWCLYEAHREVERKFLAKAVCMIIAQDASTRGPLLLTRYVACGPTLERSSGILRIAYAGNKSGAHDLAKAVHNSIRNIATKRRPHPNMYKPSRPPKRFN